MQTILIGIDDTDNLTSPGTGSLARRLCAQLAGRGLRPLGVTRHQFLVDKAIPFTSHNSGACIALESTNGIEAADFAFDFVARQAADGSDPGVCIALPEAVCSEVMNFGKAAQEKVLAIEDSFRVANAAGIKLRGLGGNCQGVIGALASVGLRASGHDGRFIDMPGLRQLPARVTVQDYENMGIQVQYKTRSRQPGPDDVYLTLDWVRPALSNHQPVLELEWSEQENAWIPVDRRKNKS